VGDVALIWQTICASELLVDKHELNWEDVQNALSVLAWFIWLTIGTCCCE